ncbi:MAG: hypothetical protein OYG31_02550 [Candidatus Kaiserbacteria bacterium]|nr:hypothetical protein [Candidatus Kaiserbacteria bacterium]
MTLSVISALIIVSAILYFALPIDTIRERASREISGAEKDGWTSFSSLSESVQQAFDDDPDSSVMQDMFSLPVSGTVVSDITSEALADDKTVLRWQEPESEETVRQYRIFLYEKSNCNGSPLSTSETETNSITLPIPQSVRSLSVQARYEDAVSIPTCSPRQTSPIQ